MSVHNNARKGDIANFVLLPGDPLRAKYIAETYLENTKCYNKVRNMLGYTGYYKNKRISIQSTGMGMPSHSIYITELLKEYKVRTLIRVGSCGTIQKKIELNNIIFALGASTDSSMNKIRFKGCDYSAIANFQLLSKANIIAEDKNTKIHIGNILSSDFFYNDYKNNNPFSIWREYNILGVDMETNALYTLAAKYEAKALSILTVSDNLLTGEALTSEERQNSFNKMIEIAIEIYS